MGATSDRGDGYLSTEALDATVADLGLLEGPSGPITLRATDIDIAIVRELAGSGSAVLAALDAAASLDLHERGAGRDVLATALAEYRRGDPRRSRPSLSEPTTEAGR